MFALNFVVLEQYIIDSTTMFNINIKHIKQINA